LRYTCKDDDGPVARWNERTAQFLEIVSDDSSVFIVKTEELYSLDGQRSVMERLHRHWSLQMLGDDYVTQDRRMGSEGEPTDEPMLTDSYMTESYLKEYTSEDLAFVSEQLSGIFFESLL